MSESSMAGPDQIDLRGMPDRILVEMTRQARSLKANVLLVVDSRQYTVLDEAGLAREKNEGV